MRLARAALAALAVSSLLAAARADDWPQWLGPNRNGVSAEKKLLDAFPKDGPKTVWQRDVGEGFSEIDATGNMPDGTPFDGAQGLARAMGSKGDRFAATVTELDSPLPEFKRSHRFTQMHTDFPVESLSYLCSSV